MDLKQKKSPRNQFLPFSLPTIEEDEISEVVDSLRSGWITTGPKVIRFEEDFKNYIGCSHAVAVNSGTAGLHISLMATEISDGDEVITSPMTFAATVNTVVLQRAKPVFADINPETLNINPDFIEQKITPKTKAIIPVHFAGQPCDLDRITAIAKKHNLLVIEDAAHAVGSEYKGVKIGKTETSAVFSFHPIKNITTGEGGMITTERADLAEKLRLLRFHGISKEAWKRYSAKGSPQYEILLPGLKYNMLDIQAAIGIHQLKKLDNFIEKRKNFAKQYENALKEIPEIITPGRVTYDCLHAWHLYIIKLRLETLKITRDEFIEELKKEKIGTGIHFTAIHLHPFYANKFGFKRGDFPNAEYASDRIISLPLYPKMKDEDIVYVVEAIKKVVNANKK
ncbi:MAG: UDP-4-amino-4,6-dideoxy-N-acetyl-beta-L-altrosamine transaminase [Candidatus Schekmanbacteria bacterium RBG_16_38_11]|uniref:UDP-4-amino-4, 6-dideoxy-N-acetyl-beta-L-altrosamine transaminase n=1 Tax=Candidatus Schekmanbacteria bacterium RBG_16_38_11 TaxID=1817880 RepID=A0A1F7RU63_9BACT|nr:MAG: UDP-4-amino-4,6-dideoxy-N-acetyl-beta-L-altrosamine transaminase [Candidatus Schekmanbacteria bacterium RBG_16_38_11]